jgi:hypothetical protein
MAALRSGEFVPPQDDGYDPDADMRALQGSHRRKAKEADTYMTREQLMELRKVQAERVEVRWLLALNFVLDSTFLRQAGKMKLLGMDIRQNLGVRMDGTAFDE